MPVTANSAITAQTPKVGLVQIANADASNEKTVYTAGSNGSKVVSLILTSTDTSSRIVQISITRSATRYFIGTVTVAIGSGTDGTTAGTNGFGGLTVGLPVDSDGQVYILMQSGDTLGISSTTTVTSAKLISATAVAADF